MITDVLSSLPCWDLKEHMNSFGRGWILWACGYHSFQPQCVSLMGLIGQHRSSLNLSSAILKRVTFISFLPVCRQEYSLVTWCHKQFFHSKSLIEGLPTTDGHIGVDESPKTISLFQGNFASLSRQIFPLITKCVMKKTFTGFLWAICLNWCINVIPIKEWDKKKMLKYSSWRN